MAVIIAASKAQVIPEMQVQILQQTQMGAHITIQLACFCASFVMHVNLLYDIYRQCAPPPRKCTQVVQGSGLENRQTGHPRAWVRIPPFPPKQTVKYSLEQDDNTIMFVLL